MRIQTILSCMLISSAIYAQDVTTVSSPDGNLTVNVSVISGKPVYSVTYKGKSILENSPLGVTTNEGDFSAEMSFVESSTGEVSKEYTQDKIKQSDITYKANTLKCTFANADKK